MDIVLKPIGYVKTVYKTREECPPQADSKSPPAKLILKEEFLPAIKGISIEDELIIFTWLHKGKRDVLQCHPRRDKTKPLCGVFLTRSPDRPNPIGHHVVKVIDIKGNSILIHPIEVIDGTPVVDIKPNNIRFSSDISFEELNVFKEVGYRAWIKGLLNGFSGNMSIRKGDGMIITRSGMPKGWLTSKDIGFVKLDETFDEKGFSIESHLHAKIYLNQPKAKAVLHTHPTFLLALSLGFDGSIFDLPLFEATFYKSYFAEVPPLKPGTQELADMVGKVASKSKAIFMKNHGLVCWGENLKETLALNEEIENIAKIKFLVETKNKGGLR
ncbi:MAG: tRNA (N6-threonylcarbamoyladenosine(37)-N6)-methyltransferase TrmO [Candidatus Korarchaeota archaeon]|nr:tRNA (N6-threonylcarbamoyladenosine(37)-N6)-methyltransferase TrmO [Candidatus Korarchaeota archaeon]